MDLLDDGRNLHGEESKSRRGGTTTTSQAAKFGRAVSASSITGLAATAAENLGARDQQFDHLTPFENTQGFSTNQVLLAYILGIMVGMFLMRCLQSSSFPFKHLCTASAVIFGTFGVLPTTCAGHFRYAHAIALAGSDEVRTHLTESTMVSKEKARVRAKDSVLHSLLPLPQQESLHGQPDPTMFSLMTGHPLIQGLRL